MSEAFTDTTENRSADAAAPGAAPGRHRGPVARDDQPAPGSGEVGHGRHRRAEA